MNEINESLPVIALRGLTIMPGMVIHFDVSRVKSLAAIDAAMTKNEMAVVVAQLDPETDDPEVDELFHIGTAIKIKQLVKLNKETTRVLAEGKFRAGIDEMISEKPFLYADVTIYDTMDKVEDETEAEAMCRYLRELLHKFGSVGNKFSKEMLKQFEEIKDVVKLTNQLCINLPMQWQERQKLLEYLDFKERYEALCELLGKEVEVMKIGQDIQSRLKVKIDKNQRDYILREQIKVIREELGEVDVQSEADEFTERAKKLKAPKDVKEKLEKEIRRFNLSAGNAAESGVSRNYIEALLNMPWDKQGKDNKDIHFAEQVLREDHYGLEKVKERILEFLSVRLLTKKGDAPIICLVGPPGTGKTSIVRSVARALNKKYVRISLGGMHDEAEIRGHRRTYIGAMPGRIAQGLKQAGVNNPVMLLDEIDKAGSDYKGDVFSSLLEVLDSEQNCHFSDNYIELPLDLSNVLFMATANSISTIPRPLLDRMEVIEINTYTQNEKLHIAREHLVEKQMKHNGIDSSQLSISDKALESMIMNYTREAGVRNLERRIGDICRKTAKALLGEQKKSVKVTDKNIDKYLGPKRFSYDRISKDNQVGVVRGLAWTSVGGDTLSVEVNILPGKGKFELTGQLGDVMKESAVAGISYIRSMISAYGIDKKYFEENDIHIHIPEGAVPKDGPSAGVTMTTAMLSAIMDIPVKADVAMTGEVTLRGRVLPIGGLREKSIAAKIAGIHTMIVPEANKSDIEQLDKEISRDMNFVYAGTMMDILPVAFEEMPQPAGQTV